MLPTALATAADWAPQQAALMTRWSKDVTPDKVHPDYPRPQMVRPDWLNLNGLWDYAILPREAERPEAFDGQILVPFPVEAALSGAMKTVGATHRLWYRRALRLPQQDAWQNQHVLLHFGAVDWECTVWVNGQEVGQHQGGYDPFSFDITAALAKSASDQHEIVVAVWDPTDAGFQPRGKQVAKPHGIWYTPVTGIWQTVWVEPVSPTRVAGLRIVPDVDAGRLRVTVDTVGEGEQLNVTVAVADDRARHSLTGSGRVGQPIEIVLTDPKLWSPRDPFLYDLQVTLRDGTAPRDIVTSYAGLRKISLGKDAQGVLRLLLNNQPLFQYGPLDQGWWPDGLYMAPTDEALKYDIELTQQLGFNMIRKHVKVEPARWYYWCDKLGMLVWQDMPSGDRHAPWNPQGAHDGEEIERSAESSDNYHRELRAMIDALRNHPSIVMWVPFNEAWGQFDTVRVTNWIKEYDPTRLVNCASGGNDFPVGDIYDIHRYPGPAAPRPDGKRAIVLGEFGGLGLPLEGHTWLERGNWGYRSFTSTTALAEAYLGLLVRLRPLIHSPGLAAAVYTQTTDVEIEVNGLMTYDRAVIKLPAETIGAANRKLYLPPPHLHTLVPTSQPAPQRWRYTLQAPPDGWEQTDFNDSAWPESEGGFGTAGTPGTTVRQTWNTPDIWLRRTFELPDISREGLHLEMHHDEAAQVYLNGVLAASVNGYTTEYGLFAIREAARGVLRPGKNVIAIHCQQTGGGQYIDAGLVDVREQRE